MKQYNITGMSCAACSTRIEKAVSEVAGVDSVSVNLLTNSMIVEGTASAEKIIYAVENSGYGASLKDSENNEKKMQAFDSEKKQIGQLKNRFIFSTIFLVILMYFSMGHMMWNWPLPSVINDNHIAMGLIQLLLTIIIMVINQKFFISGFKGLIHRAPNMDTLVALGSSASFIYSVYALFAMTDASLKGNNEDVMHYMHEFYFESAAMILTLITLGKLLESISKGRTTDALKGLMNLAPETAVIIRDGDEITVPVEKVRKDDIFIVKPGDSIPADGIVIEGSSAIDESALTGESIPVDKLPGDDVTAATINQSGFLKCKAVNVGDDTALSKIIKMVSDASSTKAPVSKAADKISGIFVPCVIVIAAVTTLIWLICGQTVGFSLARGISVLVISCPCALGLATPVAIMVGSGIGAKNGILFKTAASLEAAGKINIAALDKTGTITKGEPRITDVFPFNGFTEKELLELAYSIEKKSEHPLAKAVIKKAEDENCKLIQCDSFTAIAGNGLSGVINGKKIYGGNSRFIRSKVKIENNAEDRISEITEKGKTPLLFVYDDVFAGIIAAADVIKEESCQAVRELQNMGIKVVMITGDNQKTADVIGKQAGVDYIAANILPDGKERIIQNLKKYGRVAMVGDGINDAPALTSADTGIAIGAGNDIAIDAADAVLMKSRLTDVPAAVRLSRQTLKNIHENLFWAFIYNVIGIPLAAGIWIPIFGIKLNPMFAAAAMSLSSFCVVLNALRLNLFNVHNVKKDKKIKPIENIYIETERKSVIMTKEIRIKGMMCGHCEASVKKALEAIETVDLADVSYEKGTAIVRLNSETDNDVLKKAVEDMDYEVVDIK